ncbi:conserved Plasmodium protein, unknown function, partial [Plasmodium malariae]
MYDSLTLSCHSERNEENNIYSADFTEREENASNNKYNINTACLEDKEAKTNTSYFNCSWMNGRLKDVMEGTVTPVKRSEENCAENGNASMENDHNVNKDSSNKIGKNYISSRSGNNDSISRSGNNDSSSRSSGKNGSSGNGRSTNFSIVSLVQNLFYGYRKSVQKNEEQIDKLEKNIAVNNLNNAHKDYTDEIINDIKKYEEKDSYSLSKEKNISDDRENENSKNYYSNKFYDEEKTNINTFSLKRKEKTSDHIQDTTSQKRNSIDKSVYVNEMRNSKEEAVVSAPFEGGEVAAGKSARYESTQCASVRGENARDEGATNENTRRKSTRDESMGREDSRSQSTGC